MALASPGFISVIRLVAPGRSRISGEKGPDAHPEDIRQGGARGRKLAHLRNLHRQTIPFLHYPRVLQYALKVAVAIDDGQALVAQPTRVVGHRMQRGRALSTATAGRIGL